MSFEDVIGYVVIFGMLFLVFLPLLSTFVQTAIGTATTAGDTKTAFVLTLVIPAIIVFAIYAFGKRLEGEKPFSASSPW